MPIEKYLVLNKYLLSQFGVSDIKDLLDDLKDKNEGIDSDGRSYFVKSLIGLDGLQLSRDALLEYDQNIQFYVKKINFRRQQVSLKYFQYLAVLFAEIVLDNLKNKKSDFLIELNTFLKGYKISEEIELIDDFEEEDLKKLAFWMATGSGKTLITHINYYQFFNYDLFSPDNIILITPNEGLSRQHFEELQKSGISARLYSGGQNGGLKGKNEVLVIEMTKFVEEKKGGGVTLPVDAFEGRNLVFVDEGHKGKKSEEQKWAKLRNRLAEKGFVFEYSATFGQILSEKNKETLEEYAKSIVFDYSYKYFYLDGYGKDFSVLNIEKKEISDNDFQEIMFTANLLSFYEQLLVYEEHKREALDHNLEKPLWIFVGTTVTGRGEESDVVQIVDLVRKTIGEENWTRGWVDKILKGETNLKNEDDQDVFHDRFAYLRGREIDFDDLFRKVFGGKGEFRLVELKNAEGELGLRIGDSDYFGVINIGEVSGFKKMVEEKGIEIESDSISSSLFDDIKRADSRINILIGSKKFIEGWDTWRVSSMGLLNIGQGQGPQIIQLFGRGVRLKGKGMSLKRSADNPEIRLLERLNVYGIRADYLNRFLEAIGKEEVELETIEIPVEPQHQDRWNELITLTRPEKKYEEEEILRLAIDDRIYVTLDLMPKVAIMQSEDRKEGVKKTELKPGEAKAHFDPDILALFDWQRIWQELYTFKLARNYWNLVFNQWILRSILMSDRYGILSLPEIFDIKSEKDIRRQEDLALLILKKYIDLFFRKHAKHFETNNLRYEQFKQIPLPLISEGKQGYIIQVNRKEKRLIEDILKLKNDLGRLLKGENNNLPRIYFHNSIYLPILVKNKKIEKISPPGLVESEKTFLADLKKYLQQHERELKFEVYLLRNIPFSGLGFQLTWSQFYPDFIMWAKEPINSGQSTEMTGKQAIVFLDPKGLEHSKGFNDEKVQFSKEIKNVERKLNNKNIVLESFILSETSYREVIKRWDDHPSRDDCVNNHVLFLEDPNWPEELFRLINF